MTTRYPSLRFRLPCPQRLRPGGGRIRPAAVRAGFGGRSRDDQRVGASGRVTRRCRVRWRFFTTGWGCRTEIDESKIYRREPHGGVLYGGSHPDEPSRSWARNVFTQCAGVHADGDNKNGLYISELLPERFGRVREYALGQDPRGKANILKKPRSAGHRPGRGGDAEGDGAGRGAERQEGAGDAGRPFRTSLRTCFATTRRTHRFGF